MDSVSDSLAEAIASLLPEIAVHAAEADRRGRLHENTVDALSEAGAFALCIPNRFGGSQADPSVFLRTVRELATSCTSAGWVTASFGIAAWQLALFTDEAQADVWGGPSGHRARLCGSLTPGGTLTSTGRGLVLRGRWKHVVGSRGSEWAIVGAVLSDQSGAPVDFVLVLVNAKDYRIEAGTDALGLRGADMNDLVVAGVSVPQHRVFGTAERAQISSRHELLYRFPQSVLYVHALTEPIIGAAQSALRHHIESVRSAHETRSGPLSSADRDSYVTIARAAGEIDTAALLLDRSIEVATTATEEHRELETGEWVRGRRDPVLAFERVVEAVELIFATAGNGAIATDDPRQRVWRDARTAKVYTVHSAERPLEVYGQWATGLDVSAGFLAI
ncbi:acyl-CoA dehydrogenase family protein [Rhodococcus sp. IEGM 1379]|uniref:acyl-CoA dehydrogenase family protein n=1 Tax=Rhodococcus sp. IEGM 1379 TaxID=3047086 RepID=UPI0024B779E5|nr:acyl-CoA dehydrogenase family protein [Rhodococcus sp. IEGM 1379]MDI9914244.1 acyl-CoA dehydrogenase family protein [Rhodococcus sp. IEGM 1379]